MKKQNLRTAIAAAMGMLVLILDGRTAISGAVDGINLCLTTLVPSLFPFFLLSILLTGALSGQAIPLLRPVAAACRIPRGTESLLAIGLLGGYPVGAQNVAVLHRSGRLSRRQAARMIAICNNAGPAFIFGVLGSMFSGRLVPWLLWIVHIVSALAVGLLLPAAEEQLPSQPPAKQLHITDALEQSVKVMALVCGWVILMRIVLAFLERWFLWLLPDAAQVATAGILELSNGCVRLAQIESEGLRFILAGGMLSLGGICVTLQTASVTDGIGMGYYFPGKILQCCISVLLCCILQPIFPESQRCFVFFPAVCAAAVVLICSYILRNLKNSSGIPSVLGV